MKTKNKIALITGSSQGIGAGIAEYLLNKDFFVYVTYFKNEALATEQFKGRKNCKIVKLDVRDEKSVKKVFDIINTDFGRLDLLVNNANIEIPGTTEEIGVETWRKLFEVRVTGTFLCTKYALPLMKKTKRSTLINIASALPDKGRPRFPAHTAAEAAVISYTKTCAIDLARYGVRCHNVNPTMTRTGMWVDIGGYNDDDMWENFAKQNPLGRVSTPLDVGKSVYFLTTDDAEYLNGLEFYVNGGSHLK